MRKRVIAFVTGLLALAVVAPGWAQTNRTASPAGVSPGAAQVQAEKQKKLPFRGKLTAVDKTGRTITVGKRTFYFTAETKFFKNSATARIEEMTAGELVTGSYTKAADGKLLAATIYLGGKKEQPESK